MRRVRPASAQHRPDRGLFSDVVVNRLQSLVKPPPCAVVPGGKQFDVAELASSSGHEVDETGFRRDIDRLVEYDGPFHISPARRMDKRRPECEQRLGLQCGIPNNLRFRRRLSERLESRVDGSCGDRGAAGIKLSSSSGAATERRCGRHHRHVDRVGNIRPGLYTQLFHQQSTGRLELRASRYSITGCGEAPDQQRCRPRRADRSRRACERA